MARILVVREFEPLPIYPSGKKLRTSMLADALLAKGHDVTWFASTFNHMEKKCYFNKDTEIDLSDHYHFILRNAGGYGSNMSRSRIKHHKLLAKKLRQYLEGNSKAYDLIIASHPTIETCYEAVKFGVEHHIPVITDVRDMWPDTFRHYLPSYLRPLVDLATIKMHRKTVYSFRHATVLTSMSQFVLDWAVKKSHRQGPIATFYLGSSLNEISDAQVQKSNPDKGKLICTYVGGLIRSYDLSTMLEASLELIDDIEFQIVGDGPMRQHIEKLPYGSNVSFKGWRKKQEVVCYLKQADILVLPVAANVDPNMPNKLFDYLWAGKPILACIYGEAADLIRDYELGYVYEHNNIDDFMRGLNYLSDPEKRAEISKNINKIYEEKFRSEKIYAEFSDLIQSMLSTN